jgi:hypothetical protein
MNKQQLIDAGYHQLTEPYHLDEEADMLLVAMSQAGKNGEEYKLLWEGMSVSIWTKPKHIIPPEHE